MVAFQPLKESYDFYSRFQITFPRRVAKFVGKLGTRFRSSQLRGQLDNEIANFESKFPTSAALNFAISHLCVNIQ